MNRQELENTLRDLDRRLSAPCDVIVVGGAAMILWFGANRATRDIDVIPLRGGWTEVRRGAEAVARDRGLPLDWIADAAKAFADVLPPDSSDRLIPLDLGLTQLRAFIPGLPDLVALKAVALREQDLEDLELLAPRVTEDDKMVLARTVEHLAKLRPDWAQKLHYFLLEKGWQTD